MVGAIVLTATAGDVLLASAMRGVGDLDQIKEARGLPGAIWAVVSEGRFLAGGCLHGSQFLFSALFPEPCGCEPDCSGSGFPYLCQQRCGGEVGAARERRSPALAGSGVGLLRRRAAQTLGGCIMLRIKR